MRDRYYIFGFVFLLFCAAPAYAYVGPGLGVALAWTLLGPLAALLMLIAMIAYFPARYYYKKHKSKKEKAEGSGEDKEDEPSQDRDAGHDKS